MVPTLRPRVASPLARPLGVLVVLLVGFRTAQEDPVFRYDEPLTVVEATAVEGDPYRLEPAHDGARSARLVGSVLEVGAWRLWDEYDEAGGSYDVLASRRGEGGSRGPTVVLAGGPRHQVRPVAVEARDGVLWVAWEEGPENWGHTYRSVDQLWNNATDEHGPLHSWSEVRLARLDPDGTLRPVEVPMPAFARAAAGEGRRPGARRLGVYYERPALALDGEGAVWLGYRHMEETQLALAEATRHHIERGYAVDVLRLTAKGLEGPWRASDNQRDGNQFLALEPLPRGVRVRMGAGRRDRVKREGEPGVLVWEAVADAPAGQPELGAPIRLEARGERSAGPATFREPPSMRTVEVGGAPYTLLFGDLHRHTDLSLCFPFYDGSLDDAYRYAKGPAGLDFVAITDHARDLDRGRVGGLPWELTVAMVDRHHRAGDFAVFYSYERSQGDTDHNVIALDPGVLRPHQPPLRSFWEQFDAERVLTIPHATAARPGARFCGNVWTKRDDDRRMLAEVYQSYRDVDSFHEITEKGHGGGHPLGFIASSDHLATSSGYACVWAAGEGAEAVDREPIFAGLRARRTYGATARVRLRVTSGDAWMGEELRGDGPFPIDVRAEGAAPVARVEFWASGALAHVVEAPEGGAAAWTWPGPPEGAYGWCSVVVHFADGERAWASPFFARWERAGPRAY